MLRVVIDTSSLVSYLLMRGEVMSKVMAQWRVGAFVALSSPATRGELAAVLARPAIRRMAAMPLDDFVRGVEQFTEPVPGRLTLNGACRDPKDDKFLACAVEGAAHYLLSSDSDLLTMRRYEQIAIVNPGQFLLALDLYALDADVIASRFHRDVLLRLREHLPLEPETLARLETALFLAS